MIKGGKVDWVGISDAEPRFLQIVSSTNSCTTFPKSCTTVVLFLKKNSGLS